MTMASVISWFKVSFCWPGMPLFTLQKSSSFRSLKSCTRNSSFKQSFGSCAWGRSQANSLWNSKNRRQSLWISNFYHDFVVEIMEAGDQQSDSPGVLQEHSENSRIHFRSTLDYEIHFRSTFYIHLHPWKDLYATWEALKLWIQRGKLGEVSNSKLNFKKSHCQTQDLAKLSPSSSSAIVSSYWAWSEAYVFTVKKMYRGQHKTWKNVRFTTHKNLFIAASCGD